MISGKQLKQVLDFSFTGGDLFLPPTASFIATPNVYAVDALPASVTLAGSIIPNDGTSITWTITNVGGTVLSSGATTTVNYVLPAVPSAISTNLYNLNVTYTNTTTALTAILVVPTYVTVTATALIGQINSPTQTIVVPGDLTPYEGALTVTTQSVIINPFDVVAANVGRIVFTVPTSYGTVTSIEDGAGLDVLDQFTVLPDPGNARTIYTTINVLTASTYSYKIIF